MEAAGLEMICPMVEWYLKCRWITPERTPDSVISTLQIRSIMWGFGYIFVKHMPDSYLNHHLNVLPIYFAYSYPHVWQALSPSILTSISHPQNLKTSTTWISLVTAHVARHAVSLGSHQVPQRLRYGISRLSSHSAGCEPPGNSAEGLLFAGELKWKM